MNKLIKKILTIIGSIIGVILIIVIISFGYLSIREDGEKVYDGVIKLNTTTKDSGSIVSKCLELFVGQYESGLCSSAVKTLDNSETIVGRNLDITLSNYPIYLGKTDIEGFYKTIYVTNLETLGPEYQEVIEKGIPKYMRVAVPFLACDSLNSEGLYVEINMRANQKDDNGDFLFSCSGTNPSSNIRMNACELPTYLTLRCKNVEEALSLIDTLDIYTTNDEESWTLCLLIADQNGNYGVVEFGLNEVRWLPNQNIQTNFYLSNDLNKLSIYKQGLGRYDYLKENIDNVKSEDNMLDLLKGVKYSEIYNLDNPTYDIRSEFAGDEEYLTNDYLADNDNWNTFLKEYKKEVELFNSLNLQDKKDANEYWVSLYTTITNLNKKSISISFFEEYKISYVLDFE